MMATGSSALRPAPSRRSVNRRDMLQRHIDDQHRRAPRDPVPVDRVGDQARGIVAGQECHRLVDVAVGQRDSGIGQPPDAGRNAGHDAERDAGLDQRQRLLAAAGEDERVAALEPQHPPPGARQLDQPQRDIALLRRRLAAALAGVFDHAIRSREGQDLVIDQGVVNDHVGHAEGMGGVQGHQPGVAGPGAGQPYRPRP